MYTTLAKLSELAGPSGYEGAVSLLAEQLLRPLVDSVSTDALGNVFGFLSCGKPNAPTMLLDAHLDEIGLMVIGHKDGFVQIRPIGGIDPRIMIAHELRFMTEPPVMGVVGCLPPHVQDKAQMNKNIKFDDMFVDVGLSQEEAVSQIPIGTMAVFASQFVDMGQQVMGKALDDRACFLVLLKTLTLLKETSRQVDLIICASVQEEVGSRGATVAAYGQAPDCCVAVDVTHGKTIDAPKDKTYACGAGPCIAVGPSVARWMSDSMIRLAKEQNIPYQIEVCGGDNGTNGWMYQVAREGIPTAVLSLPLKYMHTPSEMFMKSDFDNTAALLAAFVANHTEVMA